MSEPQEAATRAVLFDLDGTLIDSAPDLGGAANRMRQRRGLAPLPLEDYRHLAGAGARGMLKIGFGLGPDNAAFDQLKQEFFDEYEQQICQDTVVFDGITELVKKIKDAGMAWGIVTNKMERFTLPLLELMPWLSRADAVVCGDTTAHPKPHPEPLYEACRRLGIRPDQAIYVGDDERDILAGKAAGMPTVAACYGYLGEGHTGTNWGADHIVHEVGALAQLLKVA